MLYLIPVLVRIRSRRGEYNFRILGQRPVVLGKLRDDAVPRVERRTFRHSQTSVDLQFRRRRRCAHARGGLEELEFVYGSVSNRPRRVRGVSHGEPKVFVSRCTLYVHSRGLIIYVREVTVRDQLCPRDPVVRAIHSTILRCFVKFIGVCISSDYIEIRELYSLWNLYLKPFVIERV